MRLLPSLCAGVLALCAIPSAFSQTVISRNNVFDDLEQAERTDMNMLATRGKPEVLATFKGMMTTDEAVLLQVLRPVLAGNRWVDCAAARSALEKAIGNVSTTTGLIAIMTTGMRVDTLHCNASASGIPQWSHGLPQALMNIQGRLPTEFGQTRTRLARANTAQVLEATRARVSSNPDVKCMAPLLYQSRQRGEAFQDAQRKAVSYCIRAR